MKSYNQGLIKSQKHTFFLNRIKDKDFDHIKDYCDKNSFHETVLEINIKAIKFGKIGLSTNQYGQQANNITTSNGTTDHNPDSLESVKIINFLEDTYKFLSPDVKYCFGKLRKAAESVKTFMVKYGDQYLGGSQRSQKSNKNARRKILTTITTMKNLYKNIHPRMAPKNNPKREDTLIFLVICNATVPIC